MQIFWDYEERSTIFSVGSIVTLYHLKYMYIHTILKYYIFSSRIELYHSLRQLVYLFEFWMFCFGFFVISFAISEENMCPLERWAWHWHWKASYRWTPGIWGIKTTPSQELPSVSTRWPKEAHHPDLLFSILCNISMQAWLTQPYFIFNWYNHSNLFQENIFRTTSFSTDKKNEDSWGSHSTMLLRLWQSDGQIWIPVLSSVNTVS